AHRIVRASASDDKLTEAGLWSWSIYCVSACSCSGERRNWRVRCCIGRLSATLPRSLTVLASGRVLPNSRTTLASLTPVTIIDRFGICGGVCADTEGANATINVDSSSKVPANIPAHSRLLATASNLLGKIVIHNNVAAAIIV